jgi:hypothetical protein
MASKFELRICQKARFDEFTAMTEYRAAEEIMNISFSCHARFLSKAKKIPPCFMIPLGILRKQIISIGASGECARYINVLILNRE